MHFCEVENDFCRHSSSFLEDEALDEEWKWNARQDRFQKGIGDAIVKPITSIINYHLIQGCNKNLTSRYLV